MRSRVHPGLDHVNLYWQPCPLFILRPVHLIPFLPGRVHPEAVAATRTPLLWKHPEGFPSFSTKDRRPSPPADWSPVAPRADSLARCTRDRSPANHPREHSTRITIKGTLRRIPTPKALARATACATLQNGHAGRRKEILLGNALHHSPQPIRRELCHRAPWHPSFPRRREVMAKKKSLPVFPPRFDCPPPRK